MYIFWIVWKNSLQAKHVLSIKEKKNNKNKSNLCCISGRYLTTTVRVAYYEPAYYGHLFIMNQTEGPNRYILIAFVLNEVRLI